MHESGDLQVSAALTHGRPNGFSAGLPLKVSRQKNDGFHGAPGSRQKKSVNPSWGLLD